MQVLGWGGPGLGVTVRWWEAGPLVGRKVLEMVLDEEMVLLFFVIGQEQGGLDGWSHRGE